MQNLYRLTAIALFFVVLFGFWGCTQKEPSPKNEPQKIQIVASFYPLAYFAERIGGDLVKVQNLSGEKDLHSFSLAPNDYKKMESANLVIMQGGGMESWGTDTTKLLRDAGVRVFVVGEHLSFLNNEEEEHEDEHHEGEEEHEDEHHHHGEFNPHTWLSPKLARDTAKAILEDIIALDPAHKDAYQENAKALFSDFDALDTYAQQSLSSCKKNLAIVGHDAFLYFAKDYNFQTLALAGISSEDSPSAQKLIELKGIITEHGLQYILSEENETSRFTNTLAQESNTKLLFLDPIEIEKRNGLSYLERMEENIDTFATALECQ